MSFRSTKKPLGEWKWYVRASDKSIHQSPDPVVDGVEVSAPPDPASYTWDWQNNQWIFDTVRMKSRAQREVDEELKRVSKFNLLTDPTTLATLRSYVGSLQAYVRDYSQGSARPVCPASLEDNAFFS